MISTKVTLHIPLRRRDWIAAHKDELGKLEPTGDGVDFSDKAQQKRQADKKAQRLSADVRGLRLANRLARKPFNSRL
jgi:hypothetical protein